MCVCVCVCVSLQTFFTIYVHIPFYISCLLDGVAVDVTDFVSYMYLGGYLLHLTRLQPEFKS